MQADSLLPLYHRVYLLLRQQILEGMWPEDRAMPGEHELAAAHAVSRITVRSALQRLEEEGLILRRRGAGTFAQPPAPEKRRETLRGTMTGLQDMGQRTQVRLLSFGYVKVPPEIAGLLDVPAGTAVQKSVRVRTLRGAPFSYLTAWVPEEIGLKFQRKDLGSAPMLSLLEKVGFTPAHADQTISAKLADGQVAKLLKAEPGSALLWTRRQVWDVSGRVIEVLDALYRPDRYEYQVKMTRNGTTWSAAEPDRAP